MPWKISTSSPYAAPTDSRLSTIAVSGITTDRNVISSSRNASAEHERDHPRHPRLHLLVEVVRAGGLARDGVVDAVDLAERPRQHDVAQRGQRGERRLVVAVPGERDLHVGDGVVLADR